jgi:hypothetical protein
VAELHRLCFTASETTLLQGEAHHVVERGSHHDQQAAGKQSRHLVLRIPQKQ